MGYKLIGGRLLATERGAPAALFMYDDAAGQRLTLLLRPTSTDLRVPEVDTQQAGISGCVWITNGIGYAVVAAMSESELDRVVDKVRAEFGTG